MMSKEAVRVFPPLRLGADLKIPANLTMVDIVVGRIWREVIDRNRGSYDYDVDTDMFILHLKLDGFDRTTTTPYLKDVEDVWVGIKAKTTPKDLEEHAAKFST